MPNHIRNKVEIIGDQEIIDELKSHMFGTPYENDATNAFDFNKILPSPKGLDITSDGWIALLENQFSWHRTVKEMLDRERTAENFEYSEDTEKTIDNFAQGMKNYLKYGFCCWYDWNIGNWGTKWNSYDLSEWEENIIIFDTAWSGIPSLIEKLSKIFPELEIRYYYSDEDTGANCGFGRYKDGELDFRILENGSTEAYELAFELRPNYKEDYEMVNGSYQYKDEDE